MRTRSEYLADMRKTIANNVRYHRQQRGMGQQALADLVGVYKSTIYLIETPAKEYNIPLAMLTTIAHTLNLPMAELFVPRKSPPPLTGSTARRFLQQQREVLNHDRS
jgi:DNA-binding XRE family transcriptional regulator